MRHACIDNVTVVEIVNVMSEEQYKELASRYSSVVLIEDLLVQPEPGWVLNGIVLEPGPEQVVAVEQLIKSRIIQFQKMAPELLVDLYTQNTLYGITTSQSDQMFDDFEDVLLRLREGAWPTAIFRLNSKQPSGFVTQELIDAWKQTIINKMI